jgi:hypothetical protein
LALPLASWRWFRLIGRQPFVFLCSSSLPALPLAAASSGLLFVVVSSLGCVFFFFLFLKTRRIHNTKEKEEKNNALTETINTKKPLPQASGTPLHPTSGVLS